jgi:hypothetical protein
MNFEIQLLTAFKQLLNTQSDLFKASERTELEALITPLPDEIQPLADAIALWCDSHPDIQNTLMALVVEQPSGKKGPGGIFPTPETQAEFEQNSKEIILNALRQSSPPEKPQTSNS